MFCSCLSVCLLARLLENACMDLDEMLRVDRCRDMDELIFLRYRINGATRNFTSGKSHICVLAQRAAAATRGFKMVLFT